MEQAKQSIWTQPATSLIVTASALVFALLFERWASSVDGTGFRPFYMIGVLAAVYGTSLIVSIATKIFRIKSRLLADINVITAVLVAIGAIGLADIVFDLY